MKRPNIYDKEIIKAVVKKMTPYILKWCEEEGQESNDEEYEQIETDLAVVLDSTLDWDSYNLTKLFEDEFSCDANAALVDVMSNVERTAYKLHKAATKAWVLKNGFKPELAIGTMVTFDDRGETTEGKINKIFEDTAQYVVNYDKESEYTTYGGRVLGYEDVKVM